jgi:hypothetical protein
MLDALDTLMTCVFFFTGKLPPTSKGEVEDGRHIDTNIGKGQNHNTKKSLSISKVEYDSRSDPMTLGDMEVLFTYVTHPYDHQELDTHLVGYTTTDAGLIVPNNQPQPSLQQRKTRLATKTKSRSNFGGA